MSILDFIHLKEPNPETMNVTPEWISELKPDEIFVFGCRRSGRHYEGAANFAREHFGAIVGQGEGLQGQSYAIPTAGVGLGWIRHAVYWSIYECKGRSAIQLLLENKRIQWYLAYASYMLLVLTIGLNDISSLKFMGLIVLPPVLYIMLSKTMCVSIVLTRNCIALSIAGWLYWLTLDAEQWLKFVWFGIAIFLIGYVLVITIIRTKEWAVSLILFGCR